MTTFRVELTNGRVAEIACDELTTRQSGDLWALRSAAPPDKLAVVAIWAAKTWTAVFANDAQVLFHDAPQPATPEPHRPTPRAI